MYFLRTLYVFCVKVLLHMLFLCDNWLTNLINTINVVMVSSWLASCALMEHNKPRCLIQTQQARIMICFHLAQTRRHERTLLCIGFYLFQQYIRHLIAVYKKANTMKMS